MRPPPCWMKTGWQVLLRTAFVLCWFPMFKFTLGGRHICLSWPFRTPSVHITSGPRDLNPAPMSGLDRPSGGAGTSGRTPAIDAKYFFNEQLCAGVIPIPANIFVLSQFNPCHRRCLRYAASEILSCDRYKHRKRSTSDPLPSPLPWYPSRSLPRNGGPSDLLSVRARGNYPAFWRQLSVPPLP